MINIKIMKKIITILLTVSTILFFTNDSKAQNAAEKAKTPQAKNIYTDLDGTMHIKGAVKVHPPKKQELINVLQQRLASVNANTKLTAVQKQELIDKIEAKLTQLSN